MQVTPIVNIEHRGRGTVSQFTGYTTLDITADNQRQACLRTVKDADVADAIAEAIAAELGVTASMVPQ